MDFSLGRRNDRLYNPLMTKMKRGLYRYITTRKGIPKFAALAIMFVFSLPSLPHAQSKQQIKVLVESQQSGNQSHEAVQGSGNVVIRRGNVHPSARLGATDRQTTVQRSTGIFTLVQDGGESILTVATRVPYQQVLFYRDYITGAGYVARSVVFNEAGTSLRVSARVLPDNQVHVRLTPRISYFSPDRSGAIDVTEAATELIVPNGQPVSLGGATTQMHEITREILGFSERQGATETSVVVTATVQ